MMEKVKKSIDSTRSEKLEKVQSKIDELKRRGLLKKQQFVSRTTSEIERIYCNKK